MIISPSKKYRKVYVKDKQAKTLLPMIEYTASVCVWGGYRYDHRHPSYSSLGESVRIDVEHHVVNDKDAFVSP